MNAHQRSLPALAVFLTAIGSAAVMTACGPEKGDPVMPRMDTPATAAAPATRTQPAERRAPPVERHLGRVTGVESIVEAKKPTGAGAVIGGVVGAVGGGFAGNEIEKRRGCPPMADRGVSRRRSARRTRPHPRRAAPAARR